MRHVLEMLDCSFPLAEIVGAIGFGSWVIGV